MAVKQQWLEYFEEYLLVLLARNIGFCAAKLRRYSAANKCVW